jgi:sugar lactone lactonase YvrE
MRARNVILLASLCFIPAHLAAQTTGPTLYVSNINGEILRVNGATGETAVVQTLPEFYFAEDLEMCGDGRIYMAAFDRIYRMKTDGTELEVIFDQLLYSAEESLGTYYPQGLACDGRGNLLTNSRFANGGVWRIANVARTPFEGTFATPEDMSGFFSNFG